MPTRSQTGENRQKTTKKGKRKADAPSDDTYEYADRDFSVLIKALKGKSALSILANEFVARFSANADAAGLLLTNTVLALSGGDIALTQEQYMDGASDDTIKVLQGATFGPATDALWSVRAKTAETFRMRVSGFVEKAFVDLCNTGLDSEDIDIVVAWITAISSMTIRSYRQTGTLAAVAMGLAFAKCAAKDVEGLQTARRQSTASKKRQSVGSAKKMSPNEVRLTERVARFDDLLSQLFDGVLVHRYRDAVPDVRAMCAAWLGELVAEHPHAFLQDTYLKYLGWMLFDRDSGVREATIKALAIVYGKYAKGGGLLNFTIRFKVRILEMAFDKDESVAAGAITLCRELADVDEALEHEDTLLLYRLTNDARPKVRHAAVQFANSYFLELIVRNNMDKSEDLHETQLKALVELVVEFTDLPDNPVYLVDALYSMAPALSKWKLWVALLEDPVERGLQPQDALPLARLASAVVRKATGAVICPGGTALGSARGAERQRDDIEEARASIAKTFGPALSELFVRYAEDPEIIAALAEIVPCMDIDHAGARSKLVLVQALTSAMTSSVESLPLERLAAAWQHVLTTQHAFLDQATTAHAALSADLNAAVIAALDTTAYTEGNAPEDIARNLGNAVAALRRLASLRKRVAPAAAANDVQDALDRYLFSRTLDQANDPDTTPALTTLAVELATPLLLWQAVAVKNALSVARSDKEEDVQALDTARQQLAAMGVPRDGLFSALEKLMLVDDDGLANAAYAAAATLAGILCVQRPANALTTQISPSLVDAMLEHLKMVMNLPETDDTVTEDRQARVLASFASLIVTGAVELKHAASLYPYLVHPSPRVQALVRSLQKKLRDELDSKFEFEWAHRALVATFESNGGVSADQDDVPDLDDVSVFAQRMRDTFGGPIRPCPPRWLRLLALLVAEGVAYVVQPFEHHTEESGALPVQRFAYLDTVLVPLIQKLSDKAASKVLELAREKAAAFGLAEDNAELAVFWAFIEKLRVVASGQKLRRKAAAPASATKKKLTSPTKTPTKTPPSQKKRSSSGKKRSAPPAPVYADDEEDEDSALDSYAGVSLRSEEPNEGDDISDVPIKKARQSGPGKRKSSEQADDAALSDDGDDDEDIDDKLQRAHTTMSARKKRHFGSQTGSQEPDSQPGDEDSHIKSSVASMIVPTRRTGRRGAR